MIATILEAVGLVIVSLGVALWSVPAGLVVAGLGVVAFGLALEKAGKK